MNTYLRIKQMRNYQKFFTKMLKKQENINNEKIYSDLGSELNVEEEEKTLFQACNLRFQERYNKEN